MFWGASNWVQRVKLTTSSASFKVIDSSPAVVGTYYEETVVEDANAYEYETGDLIVITTSYYAEIVEILLSRGLIPGDQFVIAPVFNSRRKRDELRNLNFSLLVSSPETLGEFGGGSKGGGLYKFETSSGNVRRLHPGKGRGIASLSGGEYAWVDMLSGVKILNREFEIVRKFSIRPGLQPHGIAFDSSRGELVLVQPASSSLGFYDPVSGESTGELAIDKSRVDGDFFHLNDIEIDGDLAYITMFSKSGLWRRDYFDGTLATIDLASRRVLSMGSGDLWMPHSPKVTSGQLRFVESMTGTIKSGKPGSDLKVGGFLRGLTGAGDKLIAAVSEHRYPEDASQSDAVIPLSAGIHLVDIESKMSRFWGLNLESIHDILLLEDFDMGGVSSDW